MTKRPNILIVVFDSLRADHLPCYGYGRETAPHVEQLAAEGCVFDRVISAAPFSPASYASIFSNLYPHQHGVNGDTARVWPNDWPRLPEKLESLGYRTFCVSNNSFVSREMNGDRGFDQFVGPRDCRLLVQHNRLYRWTKRFFGEAAARLIDSQRILVREKGNAADAIDTALRLMDDGPQPYFGFVILMDPHALYHPARTRYCGRSAAWRRFLREVNGRQMYARLMAERGELDPELRQVAIDMFDAEVHYADAHFGRLVERLRATRQIDHTFLAVCSDHGEAFGEHGVWGHGFSLHDYMTRVPLIVRYPEHFAAGSRCSGLAQLHDLHETCVELAMSDGWAGELNGRSSGGGTGRSEIEFDPERSLLRAADSGWDGRDFAFSEFPVQTGTLRMFQNINPQFDPGRWASPMWAVRSPDWRYVEYGESGGELFDLGNNPAETCSVLDRHPDRGAELRERLEAHRDGSALTPVGATASGKESVNEAVLNRLRALGYID